MNTLNQRKLVRLIENTISQFLFFTQWNIRFISHYNVTVFLSISALFLHSSVIACSSSDNNSTYAGFTVNSQKTLIQITFKTKEYGKCG